MSRKKFLLLLAPVVMTYSCSSMFAVGHEDFACRASEQGGVCAGIDYVYENRQALYRSATRDATGVFNFKITSDYELILIGKGKRVKLPIEECEKHCDPVEGCTEEDLKPCKEGKVVPEVYKLKKFPDRTVKEVPVPVKEEDWVQRIWIEPYVDAEGNFIDGHFIYTVVRKGRWLLPDGKPAPEAEEE